MSIFWMVNLQTNISKEYAIQMYILYILVFELWMIKENFWSVFNAWGRNYRRPYFLLSRFIFFFWKDLQELMCFMSLNIRINLWFIYYDDAPKYQTGINIFDTYDLLLDIIRYSIIICGLVSIGSLTNSVYWGMYTSIYLISKLTP